MKYQFKSKASLNEVGYGNKWNRVREKERKDAYPHILSGKMTYDKSVNGKNLIMKYICT